MGIKTLKFEQKIFLTKINLVKENIEMFKKMKLLKYERNFNNFFKKTYEDENKKSDIYNLIQEPIEKIIKAKFALHEWWVQKYVKGNK